MGSLVIGASATSACRVKARSRMCSPNCCRERSLGMTPAISASGRSSGGRARRRHVTTSSLLAGSRRRLERLVLAPPICAHRVSPAIARDVFALTRTLVSCASLRMDSSSLIGSSCSRRSFRSHIVHRPGRLRARCCSTTCPSGCEPWTPARSGYRPAGSPSMSSALSATALASRGCGTPRLSRALTRATGEPFSARCRVNQDGSFATLTVACCRRSRNAGQTPSATNASGISSTHSSVC